MTLRYCDGPILTLAVAGAVATLERHAEEVDQLNVFPVPDGDTGRNMLTTMRAALAATHGLAGNDRSLASVGRALADGAMLGARGNSGVILSQVLRGMADVAGDQRRADGLALARALRSGSRAADAAVARPVEGTILTVVRDAAHAALAAAERDPAVETVLSEAVAAAAASVERTPEQLPVLRQAGVVDAGGRGFELLLRGMLLGIAEGESPDARLAALHAARVMGGAGHAGDGDGGFGFETMFLVSGAGVDLDLDLMRRHLATLGDSVLVVGDRGMARVHIHSERPDLALGYGLSLGRVSRVTVENLDLLAAGMREERAEDLLDARAPRTSPAADAVLRSSPAMPASPASPTGSTPRAAGTSPGAPDAASTGGSAGVPVATRHGLRRALRRARRSAPPGADFGREVAPDPGAPSPSTGLPPVEETRLPFALVAVASGEGLVRTFRAAGAAAVARGGQGVNPSTGELIEAIRRAGADAVLLLPNNPNVRLAAEQAAVLSDGIEVAVVPTRNAAEGIAAALALDPRSDLAASLQRATEAMRSVQTVQVTHAVRDARVGTRRVRRGQAMALDPDDGLLAVGRDRVAVTVEALGLLRPGWELVTIYYGADVALDEAERLCGAIRDAFSGMSVELVHGGQPHYAFLVAVE